MPRGAQASPPCVRPVCRRCGTLRGRIAHATLFSGTRPRCRTRQEWKYTGTRGGRLTHWSALARFGVPEMRPCGRVAHYMDTFPEVTPFALVGWNRGRFPCCDCSGGTDRRPIRGIPPRDVERDPAAPVRLGPGCDFASRAAASAACESTITAMERRKCRTRSTASVPAHDSLRPHPSRGARRGRKVRNMAGSMSSAACGGPFPRDRPATHRHPACLQKNEPVARNGA